MEDQPNAITLERLALLPEVLQEPVSSGAWIDGGSYRFQFWKVWFFAWLTRDWQKIHLSDAAARRVSTLTCAIAHGAFVLSTLAGLTPLFAAVGKAGYIIVPFKDLEVQYRVSAIVGSKLRARIRFLPYLKPTPKLGGSFLKLEFEFVFRDGTVAVSGTKLLLLQELGPE